MTHRSPSRWPARWAMASSVAPWSRLCSAKMRADSASVAGLQVADAALYAIGRYLRRRDGIVAGHADAFDEIAMTMLAAMTGRIESLLTEAGEHG